MSEQAPEAPANSGGGKMGVWAKKMGPLPAWAWAALVLGIVLVFYWYKNKNNANANAAAATASGSTSANDVPQFVNQTYTTVTPPSAPDVETGPTGPAGPQGPAGPPGVNPPVSKPVLPAPKPKPVTKPIAVVVKSGDTLTSIAKKYGLTWQTVYDYNIGASSPHTTQAKDFIKSHGPNLIYAGETFYIPPKSK